MKKFLVPITCTSGKPVTTFLLSLPASLLSISFTCHRVVVNVVDIVFIKRRPHNVRCYLVCNYNLGKKSHNLTFNYYNLGKKQTTFSP